MFSRFDVITGKEKLDKIQRKINVVVENHATPGVLKDKSIAHK